MCFEHLWQSNWYFLLQLLVTIEYVSSIHSFISMLPIVFPKLKQQPLFKNSVFHNLCNAKIIEVYAIFSNMFL